MLLFIMQFLNSLKIIAGTGKQYLLMLIFKHREFEMRQHLKMCNINNKKIINKII